MTPDDVARLIQEYGELATLRRPSGTTTITFTDVTVRAMIKGAQAVSVGGLGAQVHREVVISNDEIARAGWPGPPKRDDKIVTARETLRISAVDTGKIGDDDAIHIITAAGVPV